MAGIKWIPSVPQNPSRGLPRGIGVVLLSDPETGLPVCFMDGTVVSAMRTGAVSGLAARELRRRGRLRLDALRRRSPGADPARRARALPAGARGDPPLRPEPRHRRERSSQREQAGARRSSSSTTRARRLAARTSSSRRPWRPRRSSQRSGSSRACSSSRSRRSIRRSTRSRPPTCSSPTTSRTRPTTRRVRWRAARRPGIVTGGERRSAGSDPRRRPSRPHELRTSGSWSRPSGSASRTSPGRRPSTGGRPSMGIGARQRLWEEPIWT